MWASGKCIRCLPPVLIPIANNFPLSAGRKKIVVIEIVVNIVTGHSLILTAPARVHAASCNIITSPRWALPRRFVLIWPRLSNMVVLPLLLSVTSYPIDIWEPPGLTSRNPGIFVHPNGPSARNGICPHITETRKKLEAFVKRIIHDLWCTYFSCCRIFCR